jgi:hypothetical protein
MYKNTHKFFFFLDSKRMHASDREAYTVLGVLGPVSDLGVPTAVSRVSDLQLLLEGVSRPALVLFEGVSRPALVVEAGGVAGTSMPISPIILRSLCVLGIHGSARGGSELSGVAAAAAAAAAAVCAQLLLPPPPPLCPVATLSPSSPAAYPSSTATPPPLDAYCPPASVP